jgi:hypothetical protein
MALRRHSQFAFIRARDRRAPVNEVLVALPGNQPE